MARPWVVVGAAATARRRRPRRASHCALPPHCSPVLRPRAGQIGYAICPMIARGAMLGPDQPVILHMLDIEPAKTVGGWVPPVCGCRPGRGKWVLKGCSLLVRQIGSDVADMSKVVAGRAMGASSSRTRARTRAACAGRSAQLASHPLNWSHPPNWVASPESGRIP